MAQESFRFHRHSNATVSIQHLGSRKWLRVQAGSHLLVAEAELEQAERFVTRVISSGTAAVAAACADAQVSIVAVGNDPHLLGRETEDRPNLALPQTFAEIWRTAAAATSGASVLAVVSSYPYAIPAEAAAADAVLWTSHGGQELGPGLVDVLSGDTEPSGRLQQTWWAREADAGDVLEYDVVQAQMTYRYSPAQPLYAFGHGLTYSTVAYEGVELSTTAVESPGPTLTHAAALGGEAADATGEVIATVHVRNTGDRVAHELVALYALAPELPIVAPRTRLAAWARVTLLPGEARSVHLAVSLGLLAVWDVAADAGSRTAATPGAYRVQPCTYELASGPSAADLPVRADLVVTGEAPVARRLADLDALEAHGFHRSSDVVTSDRTPLLGSVIEVAPGSVQGWARYDGLDLTGASALTIEVADRGGIGRPSVAVAWRRAGQERAPWRPLGSVTVTSDGRYDLRTVEVTLAEPVTGPADLRITLTGGARVASLST